MSKKVLMQNRIKAQILRVLEALKLTREKKRLVRTLGLE